MKRILSFVLIAVLLFGYMFPAQGSSVPDPLPQTEIVPAAAEDVSEDDCSCVCHLYYSLRDRLPRMILDRTIDGKTFFRILLFFVQLFTWRVLGTHQYCPCGKRHY